MRASSFDDICGYVETIRNFRRARSYVSCRETPADASGGTSTIGIISDGYGATSGLDIRLSSPRHIVITRIYRCRAMYAHSSAFLSRTILSFNPLLPPPVFSGHSPSRLFSSRSSPSLRPPRSLPAINVLLSYR